MYQQQGGNIASDCFREKNLSLYSVCTSLGTICPINYGSKICTIPHLVNRCKLFLFAHTELHRRYILLSKEVAGNVFHLLLVHIVPSDVHTL